MKKIMMMVIVFVMMMSFNAFGAEKRFDVGTYYKDDIVGAEYEHEPLEKGMMYYSNLEDGRYCYYYLDGNSMKVDIYYPNGGNAEITATVLNNGEESIAFYDFEGNELAYNFPWVY